MRDQKVSLLTGINEEPESDNDQNVSAYGYDTGTESTKSNASKLAPKQRK